MKLGGQSHRAASARTRSRARGLVRSFQVTRLFGNLTVRENLLTAASRPRAGTRRARRRRQARAICSSSRRLAPLADQPAKTLSGGQRALLQTCRGFMIAGAAAATCSTSRSPASIR